MLVFFNPKQNPVQALRAGWDVFPDGLKRKKREEDKLLEELRVPVILPVTPTLKSKNTPTSRPIEVSPSRVTSQKKPSELGLYFILLAMDD